MPSLQSHNRSPVSLDTGARYIIWPWDIYIYVYVESTVVASGHAVETSCKHILFVSLVS
jgi:hypothetical protein